MGTMLVMTALETVECMKPKKHLVDSSGKKWKRIKVKVHRHKHKSPAKAIPDLTTDSEGPSWDPDQERTASSLERAQTVPALKPTAPSLKRTQTTGSTPSKRTRIKVRKRRHKSPTKITPDLATDSE